jgi:nitrogen regulatory protein P-II 1
MYQILELTKIEVLVADSKLKQIVDDLLQTISRGSASDGKIFIYDVAEAIDIRTRELVMQCYNNCSSFKKI